MSYEEIQSKHVKGRKDHSCEWCNETITKGETHLYRAYRFEGDFNAGRMHLECEKAMDRSPYDLVSEGFYPGECSRGQALDEFDPEGRR